MTLPEKINRTAQNALAEREDSPDKIQTGTALRLVSGQIYFGKATANWTSGATITLDPCDIAGTDNGKANVDVYLKTSKASESVTTATIAGSSEGVSCQIDQNTIVPYVKGSDGYYYVLGMKKQIMTEWRYYASDPTFRIEGKVRFDWGLFCTSESGWEILTSNTSKCP